MIVIFVLMADKGGNHSVLMADKGGNPSVLVTLNAVMVGNQLSAVENDFSKAVLQHEPNQEGFAQVLQLCTQLLALWCMPCSIVVAFYPPPPSVGGV